MSLAARRCPMLTEAISISKARRAPLQSLRLGTRIYASGISRRQSESAIALASGISAGSILN